MERRAEQEGAGADQSQLKIFDLLKNDFTRLSSLTREHEQNRLSEAPATVQQEIIRQCIDECQAKYNSRVLGLKKVQESTDASLRRRLTQCQEQINKYEAVFNESQQVLADYKQLKKNTERYNVKFKKIDDKVNYLQEEIHGVEEKIGKVGKKLDKYRKAIQKERKSTISSLCKECIRPIWELISDMSNNVKLKRIKRNEIKLAELKTKLNYLRANMRLELSPPKVYAQAEKHRLARQDMWQILKEEWERHLCVSDEGEDKIISFSIDPLLEKVQQVQDLASQCCSPEAREKLEKLVVNVKQLRTDVSAALKQLLDEYGQSLVNLSNKLDTSFDLENDLERQIPSNYNPNYSSDRVRVEQSIDDSNVTLPAKQIKIRMKNPKKRLEEHEKRLEEHEKRLEEREKRLEERERSLEERERSLGERAKNVEELKNQVEERDEQIEELMKQIEESYRIQSSFMKDLYNNIGEILRESPPEDDCLRRVRNLYRSKMNAALNIGLVREQFDQDFRKHVERIAEFYKVPYSLRLKFSSNIRAITKLVTNIEGILYRHDDEDVLLRQVRGLYTNTLRNSAISGMSRQELAQEFRYCVEKLMNDWDVLESTRARVMEYDRIG